MTDFEKTINNLKAHLETVSDIFGPECIEHLRDHCEWHIQYYEKNGETEHAEEYRRKIEDSLSQRHLWVHRVDKIVEDMTGVKPE